MEYSTRKFVTDTCNLPGIVQMRSKIFGGTYPDTFKNTFSSEFKLDDVREQFNGPCQYLSPDPPVINLNTNFKSMEISYTAFFSVRVPTDMFSAPNTGKSMPITVEVRSGDGTVLGRGSWIQTTDKSITEGIDIQGCVPYTDAKTSKSYSYQLVAKTPILEIASSAITLSVKPFQDIVENYIVTFNAGASSTVFYYSRSISSFISVLAKHLNVQDSEIVIYSFVLVKNVPILRWTLKELIGAVAPSIQRISLIYSKLYQSNNAPNTALTEGLAKIHFSLSTITVKVGGNLQNPQILKPIGSRLLWTTQFSYTIPNDSYADATDGSHLKFKMLIPDGESPFSNKNWLSIANDSRVIRGVLITSVIPSDKLLEYTIRITNSLGNYVDDIFYVRAEGPAPTYSYLYNFDLTYITTSQIESLYDILSLFMQKLSTYFGGSNKDSLIITNTITIPSSKTISIFYYDSSFRVTPCDTAAILEANKKIFNGRDPSQSLTDVMRPEFTVNEITTNEYGDCRPEKNLPPTINRDFLFHTGPHQVKWGHTFLSKLPEGLFHDEEDGSTSKLTVTFNALGSNVNLPLTSWIYYNKREMTVYAVPTRESFKGLSNSFSPSNSEETKYILRGQDSGGKTVATEYIVILSGHATSFYNVTFSLNLYGIAGLSYAEQLYTVVSKLEMLFGNTFKNKICVQRYEVTSILPSINVNKKDGQAVLVWTHCDIPPQTTCDFQPVNAIRNLAYENPSSSLGEGGSAKIKMNTKLAAQRFDDIFSVVGVQDRGIEACALNPPEITAQVTAQNLSFCGLHTFQIPRNAFTDKEEGSTQNLKLTLTKTDGSPLDADWIEFDKRSQSVSMLLRHSNMNSDFLFEREKTFKLTATDSSHLSRSQPFTVNIQGTPDTVDFKKILIFNQSSEFEATGKNAFIEIAKKVGDYFKDRGRSFEAIKASKTSDGFHFYEFGNCAIRSSPCDAVAMQEYRQEVSQPEFLKIFAPEFIVQSSSNSFSGPCSNDGPPSMINQWSSVSVEITKTYILQVPSNSFQDKEQGFTRDLDLELKDFYSQNLLKNFWVQFNKTSQQIIVVASKDTAVALTNPGKTLRLKLYAYDIKRQYAVMDIEIVVKVPETEYSHFITMQLTVQSKLLGITTYYTDIYTRLRKHIMTFFGSGEGVIAYTTASNDFTTTMEIRWSNTTISSTQCENAKLQYMTSRLFSSGVTVSTEFKRALSSNFNVLGVVFSYHGICADQRKPPIVVFPIPALQTSYCGSIDYTIPKNTFNDNIDGGTRKLKLDLAYQNGTKITRDDGGAELISFNDAEQRVTMVPVAKVS